MSGQPVYSFSVFGDLHLALQFKEPSVSALSFTPFMPAIMKSLSFLLLLLSLLLAWSSISYAAAIPERVPSSLLKPETPPASSSRGLNPPTSLHKRGCAFSKNVADDENNNEAPEPAYVCSTEVPSVADLITQIQSHGTVGALDSLFYSGLEGGNAIPLAKQWYCANVPLGRGAVAFDNIVDNDWYLAQASALAPVSYSKVDQFQKRLSQAFAAASSGSVYFFTMMENDGTSMSRELAWGGWEYPALTRNEDVTEIIQVDPAVEDSSRVIWRQGDGASEMEPRG